MLCVSTSHLSQQAAAALEKDMKLPLIYFRKHQYGYFVFVPESNEIQEQLETLPDGLREVLQFASDAGVEWLMVDQDGPVVPGLKCYEW